MVSTRSTRKAAAPRSASPPKRSSRKKPSTKKKSSVKKGSVRKSSPRSTGRSRSRSPSTRKSSRKKVITPDYDEPEPERKATPASSPKASKATPDIASPAVAAGSSANPLQATLMCIVALAVSEFLVVRNATNNAAAELSPQLLNHPYGAVLFGTIASYIACARMNSFFNSVGCPGGGNVICRMAGLYGSPSHIVALFSSTLMFVKAEGIEIFLADNSIKARLFMNVAVGFACFMLLSGRLQPAKPYFYIFQLFAFDTFYKSGRRVASAMNMDFGSLETLLWPIDEFLLPIGTFLTSYKMLNEAASINQPVDNILAALVFTICIAVAKVMVQYLEKKASDLDAHKAKRA